MSMSMRQHSVNDRVVVYCNHGRRMTFREGVVVEELGLTKMSSEVGPLKMRHKYLVWFPKQGNRIIVDGHDGLTICGY